MSETLFSLLPFDLNNVIASYCIFNLDNSKKFNDFLNIMNILNIKNFKDLYIITFPEYYDVTIDEMKYISNEEYMKLLYFIKKLINDKLENINQEYSINIYMKYYNIIYRKKFKEQFSGLYKIMKSFDLSDKGSNDKIDFVYLTEDDYNKNRNYQEWKGLYFRLNHIDSQDSLSEILINFLNTGELPLNYIFDSPEGMIFHWSFINYLFYALSFHPNWNFEVQPPDVSFYLLMSTYWFNNSIYIKLRELIHSKVYIEMLNDEVVIDEIRTIYEIDENEGRTSDIPFIEDIKKRAVN